MKTSRVIGSSFRAMNRNKLRTFFMMLGTLIGVTALTVVMALGQGTQQAVLTGIQRMFSGSTILLRTGSGMMNGGPYGSGPETTLVVEHSRRHQPPRELGPLRLAWSRRYGDTQVSFYRAGSGGAR